MKIMYFDTETTGLPKTREPAIRGPDNWPHLVSIAWIIDDGNCKKEFYSVVKPRWTIPSDSIAIHGITQQYAETNGRDLKEVIDMFIQEKPDVIVCHNVNYDINVVINAILWDLNMSTPKFPKLVCTMKAGESICQIPVSYSKTKYKSPKLSEFYQKVFGKKPDVQLHNSLADTRILVEIAEAVPLVRHMIGLPTNPPEKVENERASKRCKTLEL